MNKVRIHLSALGCRLNEAELEQWAGAFSAAGDQISSKPEDADVLVLNTCAVTKEAVRKSRQRVQRLHRANPSAKLVVSGCYSTLESTDALAELGIDLVVPNADKEKLVELTRAEFQQPIMPQSATAPAQSVLFQRNRHRAFIKIQDGCRYRCTFCIVTVARGAERSRSISTLVSEVQTLSASGVHEVVLTGVHVGGYGSDLDTNLFELITALLNDTDIARIRFASVEPWDLSPEFFSLFDNPRVQPHMHLPLQSGSDTVLRRMARRCKTEDFRQLANNLRERVPDFNITTDIIVGFPGETEQEWHDSVDFIDSMDFGHIHIFSYSEREGTKAASLPNPVPKTVRAQRSRDLHELAAAQKQRVLNKMAATAHINPPLVLWERGEIQPDGQFKHWGYTPNYLKVCTTNGQNLTNLVLPTKLLSVEHGLFNGEVITENQP